MEMEENYCFLLVQKLKPELELRLKPYTHLRNCIISTGNQSDQSKTKGILPQMNNYLFKQLQDLHRIH